MSWVKADYRFGDHRAVFYVTHKQMIIERTVFSILDGCNDPEGLENAVLELVKKYRPELEGCVLFYMGFNPNYGRWEFSVSHGSLPRVSFGSESLKLPLDPAYELDVVRDAVVADIKIREYVEAKGGS